jgi:hypothetical protein
MTHQDHTLESPVRPIDVRPDVPGRGRVVGLWIFVAVASVLAGAAASGHTNAWGGERNSLFLVAALLALPLVGIVAALGSVTLLAWPPLAVAAYDLVRIPRSIGSSPILTFDRLWIPGLLVYLAIEHRQVERARASRFLSFSLGCLVISYGIRSEATNFGLTGADATWIDAIVLPAILFVASARYAVTRERMGRIAGSLMIAGGIIGGIGVAERIWGFELASFAGGVVRFDEAVHEARVSGPYPVPETYALSLVVCLAATLYWMQTRRRGVPIWAVLIAGLEIAGIAFSLFRAAWIAGIIVLVASFGLRPRRFVRVVMVAGLVSAIIVAVTAPFESNTTLAARTKNTSNIYARLATYKQGLEIFRSAPLFGVGVDRYHDVAAMWKPVEVKNVEAIDFPHSSYIGQLAEQGLFGFLPLLLLSVAIWRMLRMLRRVARTNEDDVLIGSVTGAAVGFLVMSLTLTMLPYGPSNAFFAVLVGAASGRLDALTSEPRLARRTDTP